MLIDVNYGEGSTGKLVRDLHEGLCSRGHQVMSCFGRGSASSDPTVIKVASGLEVGVHAALTRVSGLTGTFSPFATSATIKLIDEFRPDVINLHELHGYYINIEPVVKHIAARGIPILWTFHCEFMYTGKCGHALDCEQWKTECRRCPQLRVYPESFFFDRTNYMFKKKRECLGSVVTLEVVTPSVWLAERVKQSFLRKRTIHVVRNGIDTANVFRPRDAAALRAALDIRSRFVVVAIGPDLMSERKGGRWVVEAAKILQEQDITFVMVGVERPGELVGPNIRAVPKVRDQALLAHYYSLGDIFLLTSRKETFSLVCAESLACGTPIVGFEAGAPSEVAPTGYGKFVPYGDLDGLCREIVCALEKPNAGRTRAECADFARRNFSKEVMIHSYERLFLELSGG